MLFLGIEGALTVAKAKLWTVRRIQGGIIYRLISYIVHRAQILKSLHSCPKTKSFGPCPTIAYKTLYITPTASTSFLSSIRLKVLYFSGCEIIPILQYWEAAFVGLAMWAKGAYTCTLHEGGPQPMLAEVKSGFSINTTPMMCGKLISSDSLSRLFWDCWCLIWGHISLRWKREAILWLIPFSPWVLLVEAQCKEVGV